MHDRTLWTRGDAGNVKIGKRTYNNLTEFSRPCQTCGKRFSIFVTPKIASGEADSNSFGLKNCEDHRRKGFQSNDQVTDETLRDTNTTMRQELAGLYARNRELTTEVEAMKMRLAKYELQPAMEAFAEGVTRPMQLHPDAASMFGAKPLTFPWEKP